MWIALTIMFAILALVISQWVRDSADLSSDVRRLEAWLTEARRERDNWEETAAWYGNGSDYYRGLVQQIGAHIGPEAYLADDGVKCDSVLCVKVPQLVESLVYRVKRWEDKEVERAVCCGENEREAKRLRAALEAVQRVALDTSQGTFLDIANHGLGGTK